MNLTLDCEQAVDGRWIAEVQELLGVVAYGSSSAAAMAKAKVSNWPSAKAKKVLAALHSIGWRAKR